jgi:acyl-CoA thioesterase-1
VKILPAVLLAILATVAPRAISAEPSAQQKAKAYRDAVFAQVPDIPGLPRVLLLGDSISMGYTLQVRKAFVGRANVHRPPENCFHTANGLKKLDTWLGGGKWDVIHFNFGAHDMNHLDEKGALVAPELGKLVATPDQYEKNLTEIVQRLKKTGARLIFATTTQIPAGSRGRLPNGELPYNAAARRVMQAADVEINDLHAYVAPRQAEMQLPQNPHFTAAGSDKLATLVVEKIAAVLPAPGRPANGRPSAPLR